LAINAFWAVGGYDMGIESRQHLDAETWVGEYGEALFHFALTRVRKKDIAEDLVQEAFLSAIRSQARFKGFSSEKTWLVGILKHKVMDYFRKLKAASQLCPETDRSINTDNLDESKDGWQNAAHWSSNPGAVYDNREFLDYVYQGLSRLPKRTADVFVYREIDGLSTAEICKLLDISTSNCWTMLYRARLRLRQYLAAYGFNI
jgi:RNA polymerase sigma-70 factor, ECF subfamily